MGVLLQEKDVIDFLQKKYQLSQFATCAYVLHRNFDAFNPPLAFIEDMKDYSQKYLNYFSLKDLYRLSVSYLGFIEKKGFLQNIETPQEIREKEFLPMEPEENYLDITEIHINILDTFVK